MTSVKRTHFLLWALTFSDVSFQLPFTVRLSLFLFLCIRPTSLHQTLCFSLRVALPLQPQELTDVLEISNMVFTSLFSLEMLLKLLALGLFGYIKNPYNGFDSIIVIIR